MEKIVAVEPPYEVSMTCTVCHAAPNPVNPPADPNHAKWNNIVFALGNQYFQEGKVFGDGMPSDDFLSQVIGSQHPGTSDTSRMATDHIFNPNTINSIENLPYRALHKERVSQFDERGLPVLNEDIKPETCDGKTCEVDTFRVLKDGADSSGVSGAVLRVFINVGSCFSEFSSNMDPIWGAHHPTSPGRTETPISRYNLTNYCNDYKRLIPLAPHLFDYLNFLKPFRVKQHKEGAKYVKDWNDPQMALGRKVYAEDCATCHSSRQPEFPEGRPTRADSLWERSFATWTKDQQIAWLKDPARVAWFRSQVENPEFFEKNYMSDDRRWPISLIGTNSARALGTNAAEGNVWEQYASVDYRTLPQVDVPLYTFKWGKIEFVANAKGPVGRGYYRTPSLWGIWTSAPFLNNNGLGVYNGGWDLQSRLAAYNDGMEKLLGLQPRAGVFAKTNRFTALTTIPIGFELPFPIPGIDLDKLKLGVPVPAGVPVASVANLELGVLHTTQFSFADIIRIVTEGPSYFQERLKDFITVFDPIEDKGHEFGYGRTVEEKRALIEFLKSL
jgi:cytochrome c5